MRDQQLDGLSIVSDGPGVVSEKGLNVVCCGAIAVMSSYTMKVVVGLLEDTWIRKGPGAFSRVVPITFGGRTLGTTASI